MNEEMRVLYIQKQNGPVLHSWVLTQKGFDCGMQTYNVALFRKICQP